MYQYKMDSTTGTTGQYVVAVGTDGKLMHVREPLFVPSQPNSQILASGKREDMHSSVNAMPIKNDVYQYVMNAASGSAQYIGLMTLGPDGKLMSVRNDHSNAQETPTTISCTPCRIIEINAFSNKDAKPVVLQAHVPHQQQLPQQHQQQQQQEQKQQQQQQQQQQEQQQQHQQQQHQQQHQLLASQQPPAHPQQQLQQLPQTQSQDEQKQQTQPQAQRQMHQQVLRSDKIMKGEREVVCAKSCRACCNIDEPDDAVDVTRYLQQTVKDGDDSGSSTVTTPRSWPANTMPAFSPSTEASQNNGPPKARFQCKICLKMFTQKVNLTTHERIHLGERPYQCKVCLKSFTQQSNLVTHERIHTGERPYQCTVCSKRFTQRQNLTAHERIHLGERPFRCQICQKSFTQRQNLTAHERIHLGERPFRCQICQKSFTQQQNLTAHERIHTTERNFTCGVCQKSFTQEANLTKHMQVHSGERPFSCQVCQRAFAQQSSLTAHERVHTSPDRRRRAFTYQVIRQQPSDGQTINSVQTPDQEQSAQPHLENHIENDSAEMHC